jgi:hypothetical protein
VFLPAGKQMTLPEDIFVTDVVATGGAAAGEREVPSSLLHM